MGASVDPRPVLRDLDQPLGKIEHLPRLLARAHRRGERALTMPARPRRMLDDPIGRGGPAQRVALVARLPAARLVRDAAKAAGHAGLLSQAVARRRFRTRGTVLIQPTTKLGVLAAKLGVLCPKRRFLAAKLSHFSPKRRHLAAKRRDHRLNFGRENHPYLDSRYAPARHPNSEPRTKFVENCGETDSPS